MFFERRWERLAHLANTITVTCDQVWRSARGLGGAGAAGARSWSNLQVVSQKLLELRRQPKLHIKADLDWEVAPCSERKVMRCACTRATWRRKEQAYRGDNFRIIEYSMLRKGTVKPYTFRYCSIRPHCGQRIGFGLCLESSTLYTRCFFSGENNSMELKVWFADPPEMDMIM